MMVSEEELIQRSNDLLGRSAACFGGSISPSLYETGRITVLASWLPYQHERFEFLLAGQSASGSWGGPNGYALVPTLSVLEALLTELLHGQTLRLPNADLVSAIQDGLRYLTRTLGDSGEQFADMIASELIIPALLRQLNARLALIEEKRLPGLAEWGGVRFAPPEGTSPELLDQLYNTSQPLPAKLHHTLEIFGDRACQARGVTAIHGNVGCSPASTAAWLGPHFTDAAVTASRDYLQRLATRYLGPVPDVFPIIDFEYAWIIHALLAAGIQVDVPEHIASTLRGMLTDRGASVAPGLLYDSDSTSVTMLALGLLGFNPSPDALTQFDTGSYFCCWPGERNPSISANAHVLNAFGNYITRNPHHRPQYQGILGRVSAWLRGQQRLDGSWLDKWHASPYYATLTCVRAFTSTGEIEPIIRAVTWVLENQRHDGSWGLWHGTAEETAYAVQILLFARNIGHPVPLEPVIRGAGFLASTHDSYMPLWHDKDLYAPIHVIDAEVLAALHMVNLACGYLTKVDLAS